MGERGHSRPKRGARRAAAVLHERVELVISRPRGALALPPVVAGKIPVAMHSYLIKHVESSWQAEERLG